MQNICIIARLVKPFGIVSKKDIFCTSQLRFLLSKLWIQLKLGQPIKVLQSLTFDSEQYFQTVVQRSSEHFWFTLWHISSKLYKIEIVRYWAYYARF